jgi:Sec-independent protein translocase protein TatA
MGDVAVVLIVILVLVLLWRGPKTLPQLGQALGRGVREARKEVDKTDVPESPSDPVTPTDPKPR